MGFRNGHYGIHTVGGSIDHTPQAAAQTIDDFTVGECLNVGGEIHTPTILGHVPCGSPDSNYKVVAKVASAADADAQCPGDEHLDLAAGGSVCLHVDWAPGTCMEFGPGYRQQQPQRIDCNMPGVNTYEATQVLPNTTDANDCPPGNVGFVDNAHNVTTCLAARPQPPM